MARPGTDFPGVGAGLVIQRHDGKVLLCRRLKAPEAGFWNIVGGKVDQMEASIDAARREAEEETGLSIGALDFLCTVEERIEADKQHWISMIYVTHDFTGEPRLTEPDKLSQLDWFDPSDPPSPLSVFAAKAFAELRR
jgi:ADP-ribose pyrophosphatase YjhB (NUDIX family)